jgi:hypothetical protein
VVTQTTVPAVYEPVTDTRGLGDAMLALNPQQRAFVLAYVETGGQDQTRAAHLAGYGGTDNSRRVQAHRLAHDDKVLRAIREVADKRVRSGALLGAEVVLEIAKDPTHKDRFKAAQSLMDRSGMLVPTKVEHEHIHRTEADDERIARLIGVARQLGMDPRQLLGSVGVTVDAEFKVVDTTPAPPEMSAAGLEDLL